MLVFELAAFQNSGGFPHCERFASLKTTDNHAYIEPWYAAPG